jgi:hypothetical protein
MIHNHSLGKLASCVLVNMTHLTSRYHALLGRGDEDLSQSVQDDQERRLKTGESVANVDKSSDEDEQIQDEGA